MNTLRLSVAALLLIAAGAAVALLTAPKRGAGRRDELLAQSQDMVSEGGPAGEPHSQRRDVQSTRQQT